MAYQFEVLLDRTPSIDTPGFTDQEISLFLTKAQDVLLKNSFKVNEGFEKNTKSISEYKELKRFYSTLSFSPTASEGRLNSLFINLPSDLRYPLDAECIVGYSDGSTFCNGETTTRVRVRSITENRYAILKNNPYKQPKVSEGIDDFIWELSYFNNSGTKRAELIYPSNVVLNEYKLWYIKEPVAIVPFRGDGTTTSQVDSEFGESAHQEIVDIAVRLAISSVNPQEYQIKVTEEKLNN